jgi:predicted extracellular nuclease
MNTHYLAWWNVENLFSVKNDPDRSEKLERALGSELDGWTASVLNKKLGHLAKTIVQMNGGSGPDLLGVCEVESEKVLDSLIEKLSSLGRSYKTVHADTKDRRGIDVAFIYDSAKYEVVTSEIFNHFILRRNATRDILQVSFMTKPDNNKLVLMGNHWPSRRGGELESEPYRIMAAETLAYFHERTIEVDGKDQAVVVMGDFNDEPFNRSLVAYALSERVERRVKSKRSRNPYPASTAPSSRFAAVPATTISWHCEGRRSR